MQHHVNVDRIEGKNHASIVGLAQDTGFEQGVHVTVDRLHIAVHSARRFADR